MRSTEKPQMASAEVVEALQQENALLRAQLTEAQKERDEYLRVVHEWAKARISPQQREEWSREPEDQGDGTTILDVIDEVKRLPN